MLLAIDVGNTRTKVWNVSRGGHALARTGNILESSDALKLIDTTHADELNIIGASVVPRVTDLFDKACRQISGKPPVWINSKTPLGLAVRYENPESLGADRLANAIAAAELYELPVIVVDLGTATKLEAIDKDKNYLGGAIMPSVEMGLGSLQFQTAQLPLFKPTWPLYPIGNDTESSLMSGTVLAHAHAIAGLIRDFEGKIGPSRVVFTGGGSDLLLINDKAGPFRGMSIIREPQLTLIGLSIAAKTLGLH